MNPLVIAVVKYILPPAAWLLTLFIPGRKAALAYLEARNKAWIMQLVNNVEERLASSGKDLPVAALVELCYQMGDFPALWAVEGLGNFYAESFRSRKLPCKGLLTDPLLDGVPDKAMTMLHAGIGLSFARRSLEGLQPTSPEPKLRDALRRFIELCDGSSRPGYTGCAYESLGLVSLILHSPRMARALDRLLADINPEVARYMWHGAGRALYFHPLNFIPGFKCPWRGIAMAREIGPGDAARSNLRAGIAWATILVNMRHPGIIESVLRYQGEADPERDMFISGMVSSIIMRYDTTPEDEYIRKFIRHVPDDPSLARLWQRDIRQPCERALSELHSKLKRKRRLEEIFRYHGSLAEVAGE